MWQEDCIESHHDWPHPCDKNDVLHIQNCLCHPIQMTGVETIWNCYELLTVPRQLHNWVLRWLHSQALPTCERKFIKRGEPHKITWEILHVGVQWTHPHVFDRIQLWKLYGRQNRTRRHYSTPGSMVSYGERTQTRTFENPTRLPGKLTTVYPGRWLSTINALS